MLLLSLFLPTVFMESNVAKAAYSPDDECKISYDSSKYTAVWMSRKKIIMRSQYGSMWKDLDEDDKLGSATIRFYYLQPKAKTGNW